MESWIAFVCANRASTRESRARADRLFDAQQLIVLADAIGPARRSGLDLTGGGPDRQVYIRVFGGFYALIPCIDGEGLAKPDNIGPEQPAAG